MKKIVYLCERTTPLIMKTCAKITKINGVQLYIFICKNNNSSFEFYFKMVMCFFLCGFTGINLLLRTKNNNRLKIIKGHLEDSQSLDWLNKIQPDIGIHNMNIIYRNPVINSFKMGIINSHIGILPTFRGRSVMEWAVLQHKKTGITAFFLDEGIDTGKNIICCNYYSLSNFKNIKSAKKYLITLRYKIIYKAINLIMSEQYQPIINDVTKGKRYYEISSSFLKIAENNLIIDFLKQKKKAI